jgi:hypothetical protein
MSDEFHPYQTPIKQMNEQNMRACLKLFQLKGVFNPSYEMCSYLVSDNVSNRTTFTGENIWKTKKNTEGHMRANLREANISPVISFLECRPQINGLDIHLAT